MSKLYHYPCGYAGLDQEALSLYPFCLVWQVLFSLPKIVSHVNNSNLVHVTFLVRISCMVQSNALASCTAAAMSHED